MKKNILIISVFVALILVLMVLRGSEDRWICQGGEWVKHGNPSAEKPVEFCGIEKDLKSFGELANSCELTNATWLDEHKECESVEKSWCEEHQGNYSECESGCRHDHDPLAVCSEQCVGVCDFSHIEKSFTVIDFNSCLEAGNPAMESYPRRCYDPGSDKSFTENLGNKLEVQDLIELTSVQPNDKISSPLNLEGQAVGNWYFEGDFPVVLTDWDGKIIAEGYVTAQPDPRSDVIPFKGILEFIKPEFDNRGTLILQKDNPSDNPELDNALEIPILFE